MQAIRTIQNITQGELHLSLPESFWGKQVEIIILTTDTQEPQPLNPRKSLRGALKQYAKPERIADESAAWAKTVMSHDELD